MIRISLENSTVDVPDGDMYSLNKFTFRIWYGKIKKWIGKKNWHKEH